MESECKAQICVPICEQSVAAIAQASAKAAEVGDLIEVRLDCLDPLAFEASLDEVQKLLKEFAGPVIVTFRPVEQGGRRELNLESRLLFWLFNRPSSSALLDIELDLASNAAAFEYGKPMDWSRVICSHHDLVGVPDDLDKIYERMATTPAQVLKIAVQADDVIDCLPVFHLLDRARKQGREMIAIAMGTAGIATRILGPSRGSFLTYGALEPTRATALGQITARDLTEIYRINKIDAQTQITGLVGLPVAHSISPQIHNSAFESAGVNAVYIPFEVRDVGSFIKRMIHPRTRELDWNVRGLSITAPHKFKIMDYLDWIEPVAKEIVAVNTVVVVDDLLYGYNTDGLGFLKPLIQRIGQLRDARCAVIGAGGAASAALWSLRQEGASATVFARDVKKAGVVAERFGACVESLTNACFKDFDVVINATPQGTTGALQTRTPATTNQLCGARLAYDLVYNPIETRFLREAREAACDTLGGLAMLITQAAEQFRLWTGIEAAENVMSAAATHELNK
jgi:3-dehydroquinate dehydratase/shikimate dehydrogenase